MRTQLIELCRDVLAPLLRADGGTLYIVSVDDDSLVLHLAGACSGCPGAPTTSKDIIEPAVHNIAPALHVVVTNGARMPRGAVLAEEFDKQSPAASRGWNLFGR